MDFEEMPSYLVKLAPDGTNYGAWEWGVRLYLSALDLWGYITGKNACPPAPVPPPPPSAAAKEVVDAANKALKDYKRALDEYNQWKMNDARTKLVLLHTVDDNDLTRPNESAQKMWTCLQRRYKPIVEVVRYTSLQKLQALRQNDDESIDDFFRRFWHLWSKAETSVTVQDDSGVCTCCRKLKEHNDKRCLYEFLIRVRPEFQTSKNLLLFRDPQPTVLDALNDLRLVEVLLQLQSTNISKKPSTTEIQCNHCGNFGHTSQKCTMRKNRRGGHSRRGSSKPFGGSSSSQS